MGAKFRLTLGVVPLAFAAHCASNPSSDQATDAGGSRDSSGERRDAAANSKDDAGTATGAPAQAGPRSPTPS